MLTSPRVTLRPLTPQDYPRLLEFKNDIELAALGSSVPPRPMSLAELAERFDAFTRDLDQSVFAIEADGTFIGQCGLFNRNLHDGTAELGIGIGARSHLGQGYGRDAIGLLLEYGFQVQNIRRIWLGVLADNERAVRCYRSVGFVEEGRLREHVWFDGRYVDELHMGLLRSEWRARATGTVLG